VEYELTSDSEKLSDQITLSTAVTSTGITAALMYCFDPMSRVAASHRTQVDKLS
jgi:hypothetical protein